MKRIILISCAIFFVMAGQATGTWWWPPTDGTTIVPQNPTSSDVVAITLSGDWPDSCIPNGSSISVVGNDIYFDVIWDYPPGIVCLTVITPWAQTESVGPLSPGRYRVYAALDGDEWTLMTEFYVAETNTYVFVPDQSIVVQTGGFAGVHETYSIEGQFQLTVDFDASTASFDGVDAKLSNGVDLDELFDMTELVGTVVSDTQIEFDTPEPLPGGKVVHLDVTFRDIYAPGVSVYLTGGFCEPWPDGFCFEMNARALKKRVFYVDANATGADDGSSWENAFDELYEAIDKAHGSYGCEIWVAKGTYKPDDYLCQTTGGEPQSQTFRIIEGVMMYGGFKGTETTRNERDWINNETILSGDLDGDGILDAENVWHVVRPTDSDISITGGIDGFTITGGYADGSGSNGNGGGIFLHAGGETHKSPTIANCKIIDNYADISGAGIFIEHGDPTVVNCVFSGNSSGDGGGVACWSGNLTLTNSMFSGNSAISDGGAIACADSNMIVTNCTFAQNMAGFMGGGIFCGIDSWVRIYNSILWDNTADFGNHWYNFGGSIVAYYSCVQGDWSDGGQTCTNDDPLFADANGPDGIAGTEDDNLRLSGDSPCINTGDNSAIPPSVVSDLDGKARIMFGTVDMGAYEFNLIHVDADATGTNDGSSWADAYTSLPYALDRASSSDEIRVAQGTYRPNDGIVHIPEFDDRKLTFQLKNGVTVKGGYAGYGEPAPSARDVDAYKTILSGDLAGNDADVEDPCDLLTEPGRAENSYHVVTSSGNDASAVLDGVTITGGNANADGPLDEHGDDGGGMYINGGSATLRDCTFAGNSAGSGGGMFIWAADPKVTGCTFRANAAERHAGGLVVAEPYLKSVTNCTFSANFAGRSGGAVWNWDAHPTYVNCVFTGNRAGENGGAMRNSDSSWYTLVNCTLSDNVAGQRGGAIDSDEWPILVNCIFWANRDSSGMGESAHVRGHYQQPSFNYCCVQGWTGALGGNGNIGADPEFADANGDDYHVAAGSPCIDAGDNSVVPPSLLTDLDGNPRIVNGTVDMGAYEFQGIIYVDDDAPNDPGPGDPEVSDPAEDGSEAHPFDTIQEAIDMAKDGDTVLVAPGGYLKSEPGDPWGRSGKIMFDGKNIKLTSADPTDASIVKNTVIRGIVEFDGTENANCILTGFAVSDLATGSIYGNRTHATISHCIISGNGPCSATVIRDCDGTISNCLITDNTTIAFCGVDPVILGCHGLIKYCTIANNESGIGVLAGGTTTLENCIIYYNYEGMTPTIAVGGNGGTLNISYCDLQGGLAGISIEGEVNWGPGNIDIDPCFVQIGSRWDGPYEPYFEGDYHGDYHLKSEGWRWDDEAGRWTYDYVTSRCIDAGNPGSPLGNELLRVLPADPNNDYGVNVRINMGAYGGTAEASMAPLGWALLADLDNNGIVDWPDLGEQVEDWLEIASEQPGDLNRDGVVNMADYALLAEDWLAKTSWYEPPIVLEIYSCYYPKLLLDKITMAGEGEITISVEGASRYSIYALREGYYTELYYCQKGETIDVDLDEIIPDKFNGVIFMSDAFVEDCYLENTNVKVMDNDIVVTEFQTDGQGRFAIELEPGNYYFEFACFGRTFLEKVEIGGEYQDFVFPCDIGVDKPNIYLYPEETIELDVDIVFPHGGRVTNSIPDYGDGWHITVEPSGVINGEYSCLFYEASVPDWSQYAAGWVVGREDLEEFFTDNMARTGFNQKEIADFVEYWIPRLVDYPYYAIYPQYNGELEETIRLEFSVQPANIIRLIYSVRGLENSNFELPEPVVPAYSREGFTVAEWGVILK